MVIEEVLRGMRQGRCDQSVKNPILLLRQKKLTTILHEVLALPHLVILLHSPAYPQLSLQETKHPYQYT